jgi:hypothetical protein
VSFPRHSDARTRSRRGLRVLLPLLATSCAASWFGGGPSPRSGGGFIGISREDAKKQREGVARDRAVCKAVVDRLMNGEVYVAVGERSPRAKILLEDECDAKQIEAYSAPRGLGASTPWLLRHTPRLCETLKTNHPDEAFRLVREDGKLFFEYFGYEATAQGPKIVQTYSRFRISPDVAQGWNSCEIYPWSVKYDTPDSGDLWRQGLRTKRSFYDDDSGTAKWWGGDGLSSISLWPWGRLEGDRPPESGWTRMSLPDHGPGSRGREIPVFVAYSVGAQR